MKLPRKQNGGVQRVVIFGLAMLVVGASAYFVGTKIGALKRRVFTPADQRPKTVAQRLAQYGPKVDAKLAPLFAAKHLHYPPAKLVFIGLKKERRLEIYAANSAAETPQFITEYPILGASGGPGPKLREGDGQVPEGLYAIESLNPNSLYHLALRIGYPNDWDRLHGLKDGRLQLGGDIMIHGNSGSVGCLAMGDPASEDIFVLAARAGIENIRVLLAPVDFRTQPEPDTRAMPAWTPELYAELRSALKAIPLPDR
jgi:hypothetical protein